MARSSRKSSAFTLIELVLVMAIIAIALAIAAPNLNGWNHGSQLRNAGDQFLTVARYAKAQAISQGKVFRLNVDAGAGHYWLTVQQAQDQFMPVTSEYGQIYAMTDGMTLAMTDLQGQPVNSADFYPSGRVTPAHVRINGAPGIGALDIECATPAEGFAYVNQGAQP